MDISEFKYAVSGFEIIGYRQKDGRIKIKDKLYKAFPESIDLLGVTYNLENVLRNRDDFPKLKPGQEGYDIEWGQYC